MVPPAILVILFGCVMSATSCVIILRANTKYRGRKMPALRIIAAIGCIVVGAVVMVGALIVLFGEMSKR